MRQLQRVKQSLEQDVESLRANHVAEVKLADAISKQELQQIKDKHKVRNFEPCSSTMWLHVVSILNGQLSMGMPMCNCKIFRIWALFMQVTSTYL